MFMVINTLHVFDYIPFGVVAHETFELFCLAQKKLNYFANLT